MLRKNNIEKAKRMAEELGLSVEFILHEDSGKTTEQAESALGISAGKILKTLILYAPKENKYVGTIILGINRLDQKKVAKLSSVKKLRFASAEQIEKLTGFSIGGVPPMAIQFCDSIFIDDKVIQNEFVIGAGGDEHCGLKFSPSELQEIFNISISTITET